MPVLCIAHNDELGREVLRAARSAANAMGTGLVVAVSGQATPEIPSDSEEVEIPDHLDEADAVLDLSVEKEASLLVVGIRRRSPVGKFLLGSAAQRLILEAEVPVLTIKEPRHG